MKDLKETPLSNDYLVPHARGYNSGISPGILGIPNTAEKGGVDVGGDEGPKTIYNFKHGKNSELYRKDNINTRGKWFPIQHFYIPSHARGLQQGVALGVGHGSGRGKLLNEPGRSLGKDYSQDMTQPESQTLEIEQVYCKRTATRTT